MKSRSVVILRRNCNDEVTFLYGEDDEEEAATLSLSLSKLRSLEREHTPTVTAGLPVYHTGFVPTRGFFVFINMHIIMYYC